MEYKLFLIVLLLVQFRKCQEIPEDVSSEDEKLTEGEKKLSDNIRAVLEHYKQPDPKGLPLAKLPEPYPVPDADNSLAFGHIYLKNISLYGINNFRLNYAKVDIKALEARVIITLEKVQGYGNYTFSTWLSTNRGQVTFEIIDLKVTANAGLQVQRDGKLKADSISMDLATGSIAVNLENAELLSGLINTLGTMVFDLIKPYVLSSAYDTIKTKLNEEIDKVAGDLEFPNSVSPLDIVIADLRKKIHQINGVDIDPIKIEDYNKSISVFVFSLSETFITGASSFQRVGNISLMIENNTVIADFEIGTQKLEGQTRWSISALGIVARAGTASFSVEYTSARVVLAQPLDTRKKPEIRGLDLEIGNIQVRCDGAGTLDYAIEMSINILPNLLRYQIMDALETPLMTKIQQELNKVNVEDIIQEKLPEMDEMDKSGFKLSNIIGKREDNKDVRYDDDDFFNF